MAQWLLKPFRMTREDQENNFKFHLLALLLVSFGCLYTAIGSSDVRDAEPLSIETLRVFLGGMEVTANLALGLLVIHIVAFVDRHLPRRSS